MAVTLYEIKDFINNIFIKINTINKIVKTRFDNLLY